KAVEFFDTEAEAMRFIATSKGEGVVQMDETVVPYAIGKKPRLAVVHPMTPEQMRTAGLVEDVAANLREGFGSAAGLVNKVRFFSRLYDAVKDNSELFVPQSRYTAGAPGMVRVKDLGLRIP